MHATHIRSREVNPADFLPRQMLRRYFDQAVDYADPVRCVPAALPPRPDGRLTVVRAKKLGLAPHAALKSNDSHSFFGALGDQVVTGPTLSNVNDFRALLVCPQK